ncbi:Uu.00g056610.m01.CDS01 [Anthostomella pinea]|uniref:Uu.00g056610.m01.CDS01 n=1 Tax=Anthostomella pinea TaxID=933095 RepID=A0AAI8VRG2_9PEZI|nr:Uu.00g056610.m01.CDS01 [Anthostomella pinea]
MRRDACKASPIKPDPARDTLFPQVPHYDQYPDRCRDYPSPIYTVWQLKMRRTEKVAVTACFLIGLAVIIAAIFRMIYVSTVDIRGDLTGTMPITVFLSAFEPNLSVLCASIPMLRPCYTRYGRQQAAYKLSEEQSSAFESGLKDSDHSRNLKHSKNSRANFRKDGLELGTLYSPEHDFKYNATVDAGNHTDEARSIDDSVSEKTWHMRIGHRTQGSRSRRNGLSRN